MGFRRVLGGAPSFRRGRHNIESFARSSRVRSSRGDGRRAEWRGDVWRTKWRSDSRDVDSGAADVVANRDASQS